MQLDNQNLRVDNVTQPVKVGQVFVDPTRTVTKSVFFVRGGGTQYYFQNGICGVFVAGAVPGHTDAAFVTDITGFISELNAQIKLGNSPFYVVEALRTITEEQLDPLDAVKKAAVEAYKAQLAREVASDEAKKLLNSLGVGTPDPSHTAAVPVLSGIANSMTVASAMAGSDGSNAVLPAAAPAITFKSVAPK